MTSTPNNSLASIEFYYSPASLEDEYNGSDDGSIKSKSKTITPLREQKLQERSLTDYRKKQLCSDGLFATRLESSLMSCKRTPSAFTIPAAGLKRSHSNESQSDAKLSSHRSQSDKSISTVVSNSPHLKLHYLLGTAEAVAEDDRSTVDEQNQLKIISRTSQAIKAAEDYFKTHKILDFFQFLMAHILNARSDNPIEDLLGVLNKMLLYRSGSCQPPLLYGKRHLEQLFYLMDRMRTGFITINQYKSGMATLGIYSYNPNPPLSAEGLVSKECFINEAYDCLVDHLNEMIQRRSKKPFHQKKYLPSFVSDSTSNGPHFIPPELFLRIKHTSDIVKYVTTDNGE